MTDNKEKQKAPGLSVSTTLASDFVAGGKPSSHCMDVKEAQVLLEKSCAYDRDVLPAAIVRPLKLER